MNKKNSDLIYSQKHFREGHKNDRKISGHFLLFHNPQQRKECG